LPGGRLDDGLDDHRQLVYNWSLNSSTNTRRSGQSRPVERPGVALGDTPMQKTLRAAAQIRTAIEKAISEIELSPYVDLPLIEPDVDTAYGDARKRFEEERLILERLERTLASVRKAIGDANARTGINELMADKISLERLLKRLDVIIATTPQRDSTLNPMEQAKREIEEERKAREAARAAPNFGMYGEQRAASVRASLLTRDDVEKYKAERAALRRRIQAVSDQLNEKNAATKIEIPDGDIEMLERHNVI
jgi:hypothetical protein